MSSIKTGHPVHKGHGLSPVMSVLIVSEARADTKPNPCAP